MPRGSIHPAPISKATVPAPPLRPVVSVSRKSRCSVCQLFTRKIRVAGTHVIERHAVDIPQHGPRHNAFAAEKRFPGFDFRRRFRAFGFGILRNRHQPLAQISHSAISLSVSSSAVFLPCLPPTSLIGPVQEGQPASHGQCAIKSCTSLKISARMP